MAYETKLTAAGLQALATALANGTPLVLAAVALGDGGGVEIPPSSARTALVREVYRAAPTRIYRDPAAISRIIVELRVPPTTPGSFTVREVGLFTASGALLTFSNFPPTFKGEPGAGGATDLLIRIIVQVSSDANVTVTADTSGTMASVPYVLEREALTIAREAAIIERISARGMTAYTVPGNYNFTVPAGVHALEFSGHGGGGGGGGSTGAASVGAGGGGAGFFEDGRSVTPGQVISLTVGAPGARGSNAGSNGGPGGATRVTGFGLYANGGGAGGGAAAGVIATFAGGGGTANGAVANSGTGGGTGYAVGGGGFVAGGGGASSGYSSTGAGNSNASTANPGNDSMFPGCGGSGGLSGGNGGLGGAGRVIIKW